MYQQRILAVLFSFLLTSRAVALDSAAKSPLHTDSALHEGTGPSIGTSLLVDPVRNTLWVAGASFLNRSGGGSGQAGVLLQINLDDGGFSSSQKIDPESFNEC